MLPFKLFNEFAGSHLTVSGRTPVQKGGYVKRHTALAVVFDFNFFTIWNYFLRHWIGRMQCYAKDLRCSLKLYFHHWEQQQTTYLLYASEQILQPLSTFFTLGTLEISSESTHRCTFLYQTSQIFGSHSKLVLIYSLFILPEYRVCISITKVHTRKWTSEKLWCWVA